MSFIKRALLPILHAISMQILSWIPMAGMLGTKAAFFSVGHCLSPLIGFFSGVGSSFLVYSVRTLFHFIALPSLGACTYYIPTLCGTLYLATNSRLIKFLIPSSCMILFLLHPTGQESGLYTLYWIAPLILSILPIRSIFLSALASTLTTHAVGSTLWLYTHQTDVLFWHALISVVWFERLTYALSITAGYYVCIKARTYAKNMFLQPQWSL